MLRPWASGDQGAGGPQIRPASQDAVGMGASLLGSDPALAPGSVYRLALQACDPDPHAGGGQQCQGTAGLTAAPVERRLPGGSGEPHPYSARRAVPAVDTGHDPPGSGPEPCLP